MKIRLLLGFLSIFSFIGVAQTAKDYSVLVQAAVSNNPASITLKWPPDNNTQAIIVYKKLKNTVQWNQGDSLPATTVNYTDNNVAAGNTYEYYIRKVYADRLAHGYIYCGVNADETHTRGLMLLLIDDHYKLPAQNEIAQLQRDLLGDGWMIKTLYIKREENVKAVKAQIVTAVGSFAGNISIYLLGHIPVPYSGFINPDGHADHKGAWPADIYYGVFNEFMWTDETIDDTTAARIENRNILNDGKFDPNLIYPDSVTAQIGRVDFSNMISAGKSDTALIKQYLEKAHRFKTNSLKVNRKALIDDNFGAFSGEAFAASAWKNFSPMVGEVLSSDLPLMQYAHR